MGITVLDVGSGNGRLASRVQCSKDDYLALELDSVCLKELRQQGFSAIKYNLEAGVLPFADEAFNLVIMSNILEHLGKHFNIAKEAYRVLRSGGIVYTTVPSEFSRYIWDDFTHLRGYTKEAIKTELETAGFSNVRVEYNYDALLTRKHKFMPPSMIALFAKFFVKQFCGIDRTIETYFVRGSKRP